MILNQKAVDIYLRYNLIDRRPKRIYRAIVSSVPLDRSAFKQCLTFGVLALQPYFSTNYSNIIGGRPPLHSVVENLKAGMRSADESWQEAIKRLILRSRRLLQISFRPIGPVRSSFWSGHSLEKAYYDILYHAGKFIESW